MSESRHEKFHDHLDKCEWCREHCFNLCKEGLRILQEAAGDLDMSAFGRKDKKGSVSGA